MSISAMLVSGVLPMTAFQRPNSVGAGGGKGIGVMGFRPTGTVGTGLLVECSSRPQKKATAHHRKTRPKKSQPWDIRRKGPTAYPPLPALPPDWTIVSSQEEGEEEEKEKVEEHLVEVVSSSD